MTATYNEIQKATKEYEQGGWQVRQDIDSGIGLSITIDWLRVFINKTLSIESAYQQEVINTRVLSTVGW